MKKIALLLACTMMLAGCTELLDDSTESTTYTNQDLDGVYHGIMLSLRVEMNADDSFTVYLLEMWDCFDSAAEANEELLESEDESGVVIDTCVYEEIPLDDDDDIQITSVLSSQSGVPYLSLELTSVNSVFTCDAGDEIPGDWVNDGDEDCAEGEDEAEGAEDDIVVVEGEEDLLSIYVAADGNGAMIYPEDQDFSENGFPCLTMNTTPQYSLMMEATEMIMLFEEDGGEIVLEDSSTYPSNVIDLFAPFDESFSNSIIPSLVPECDGVTFSQSSLLFYVWATSLAEGNTDGGFSLYGFDVSNSGSSPSSASNENLVYVQMNQGDDLNWAQVNLQLSVNEGAYMQCTTPQETIGNNCHLTDNGDNVWALGESITVSEGSDDLCDGSSSCDVRIKIIDSMNGNIIYESNSVLVSN
ncbi:MAG: hypothetical protein CBC77_001510 [Euryarchaeota archaeon TMED117]|nr:MAG: hypothetical protein CBC77_001510 [Euryarchaeota archaeon TMED117]